MQKTCFYYFAARVQSAEFWNTEYEEHALDMGRVGKGGALALCNSNSLLV